MVKKHQKTENELEERIIELLFNLMGVVQKVRTRRLKRVLNYDSYFHYEAEVLSLLNDPKLDSESKDRYMASYERIRLSAEELDPFYFQRRQVASEER